MKINTNTKIIIAIVIILTLFVGFFYKNFFTDKTREIFEKEKITLETQIAEERKIRAEKKEIQEKLYAEWQKEDKELEASINEKKERLEAVKTLLGEKSGGIIPTVSAQNVESSENLNGNGTPTSVEASGNEVERGNVPSSVEQVKGLRMMDMFGLNGCRFTNSDHRIPRLNADWYGYDYACNPGKSFSVGTPSDGWTIEKIGFDKNMGNYVIIKKNDFRIAFGHLVTSRKEGEKLNKSDIVGQTDMSGASTGMHVHIELWDGEENVSYEYMLGKPYQKKYVYSLLEDRNWNFYKYKHHGFYGNLDRPLVVRAAEFIKPFEGLHLNAYYDCFSNCKKETHPCSIGYGTVANHCKEVISEEEAERRLMAVLKSTAERVERDFPDLLAHQHVALVSLAFNCESGYQAVKKGGLEQHKNWCRTAGGKRLEGLIKRRNAEANLLFN